MRSAILLVLAAIAAPILAVQDVADERPRRVDLGAASAPGARTESLTLVAPGGERLDLVVHDVGRGGYAVRDLPAGSFARELSVLTPTVTREVDVLAFGYVPEGHDAFRLALAERDGATYRVVATSDHAASWIDWPVASPDGRRVAAWVVEDDHPLHVAEREGDRLVVTERAFAGAVKVFPRFASNGRLAARLPIGSDEPGFANAVDGVRGELLLACREVEFDAAGERWAYAGRRADGWHVFTDAGSIGPFERVEELRLDVPEQARARVLDAGAWRWVGVSDVR